MKNINLKDKIVFGIIVILMLLLMLSNCENGKIQKDLYEQMRENNRQLVLNSKLVKEKDGQYSKFVDNFNSISKNNKFFKEGMIAEDKDGLRYITPNVGNLIADNELKTYFNTPANVMRLMSLIGVQFDNDLLFSNIHFNEFKSIVTNEDLIRLYKNIKDRASSNDPLATKNPIEELSKKTVLVTNGGDSSISFSGNYTTINKIVAFAAKYNTSDPSLSSIMANGETAYAIQKHNG